MENNLSSSDFIIKEASQPKQHSFANTQEIYTSVSGYNQIFRGERYGKLHALKTLQELYCNQPFYQQALYKEFNIGYQLEHPHICHTLGWEYVTGIGQCIILEYIDGITLKEMIEKKTFNPELAYKIIIEVCEALHYLHKKQIVHRDLKPSNILITHNGNNVKLIDFSLSDCDDYDILKIPAGTRYYLAPEILDTDTPLDSRSDIYSLGIIIGEMATVLNDKKLAAISRKCTQRSPNKRYASTTEIIVQLKNSKTTDKFPFKLSYAIISILTMVGIGIFCLKPDKQNHTSYPVYGKAVILSKSCKDILLKEKKRLKDDKTQEDSLRIIKQLKAALNHEYPLHQQRASQAYQLQWENIQSEIARMFK